MWDCIGVHGQILWASAWWGAGLLALAVQRLRVRYPRRPLEKLALCVLNAHTGSFSPFEGVLLSVLLSASTIYAVRLCLQQRHVDTSSDVSMVPVLTLGAPYAATYMQLTRLCSPICVRVLVCAACTRADAHHSIGCSWYFAAHPNPQHSVYYTGWFLAIVLAVATWLTTILQSSPFIW